jgi:hypothetical protein
MKLQPKTQDRRCSPAWRAPNTRRCAMTSPPTACASPSFCHGRHGARRRQPLPGLPGARNRRPRSWSSAAGTSCLRAVGQPAPPAPEPRAARGHRVELRRIGPRRRRRAGEKTGTLALPKTVQRCRFDLTVCAAGQGVRRFRAHAEGWPTRWRKPTRTSLVKSRRVPSLPKAVEQVERRRRQEEEPLTAKRGRGRAHRHRGAFDFDPIAELEAARADRTLHAELKAAEADDPEGRGAEVEAGTPGRRARQSPSTWTSPTTRRSARSGDGPAAPLRPRGRRGRPDKIAPAVEAFVRKHKKAAA